MPDMQLRILDPAKPADWRAFHAVLSYIYRKDPLQVFPMESDIESIFSNKNAAFQRGHSRLWVLERADGQPIGRVAAFVEVDRNEQQELPNGGIGFFECINDQTAANQLLEVAENWLREQDMPVVDGPINFGERDRFWGLLQRGWYPPVFQENYHPPYYRAFFESRGYVAHEQVLTMRGDIEPFRIDRMKPLADRVTAKYGFRSTIIKRNNLRKGAEWFAEVYNTAFHERPYFKPLAVEQVHAAFKEMKPVYDPYLTCVTFHEDRPVGFVALIPDLNKYFRGLKGKLPWYKLPRFLYRLRTFQESGCKGIAFGVNTEYQRLGVFPVMIDFMYHSGNKHNIRKHHYVDLSTIRGWNKVMVKSCTSMGTTPHRVHMAYRKALIDDVQWEPLSQTDVSEVAMGDVPDLSIYPTK